MKDSRAAWSFYWSQGNTTSLPDLFPGNYAGSLRVFWERSFDRLRPGFRMLDIGTGNGAIALLAREHAIRLGIPGRIDAIDRAEIFAPPDAAGVVDSVQVIFTQGVHAERTSFSSATFDLVTGQFALEYCDVDRLVPELRRLLKQDGRLAFMLHHAGSPTIRSAEEFAEIAARILEAPSIFLRLNKCIRSAALPGAKGAPRRAQALQQLDLAMEKINGLTKRYPDNRILPALVQRLVDLTSRLHAGILVTPDEISDLQTRLEFHLRRTRDLLQAAHDRQRIDSLAALMESHGITGVRISPFHYDGALLAWELCAPS